MRSTASCWRRRRRDRQRSDEVLGLVLSSRLSRTRPRVPAGRRRNPLPGASPLAIAVVGHQLQYKARSLQMRSAATGAATARSSPLKLRIRRPVTKTRAGAARQGGYQQVHPGEERGSSSAVPTRLSATMRACSKYRKVAAEACSSRQPTIRAAGGNGRSALPGEDARPGALGARSGRRYGLRQQAPGEAEGGTLSEQAVATQRTSSEGGRRQRSTRPTRYGQAAASVGPANVPAVPPRR